MAYHNIDYECNNQKAPGKEISNIETKFRTITPYDTLNPIDPHWTTYRYDHLIEEIMLIPVPRQSINNLVPNLKVIPKP